jgi:hypothetical protein
MLNHHLGINPRIIPDGGVARKSDEAAQAILDVPEPPRG